MLSCFYSKPIRSKTGPNWLSVKYCLCRKPVEIKHTQYSYFRIEHIMLEVKNLPLAAIKMISNNQIIKNNEYNLRGKGRCVSKTAPFKEPYTTSMGSPCQHGCCTYILHSPYLLEKTLITFSNPHGHRLPLTSLVYRTFVGTGMQLVNCY